MPNVFEIPPDDEIAAQVGVSPDAEDDVGVRRLTLASKDGYLLTARFDQPGRSVSLEVVREGEEVLRLYREGATRLLVNPSAPELTFSFRTGDSLGRIDISLHPRLHVKETVLLG